MYFWSDLCTIKINLKFTGNFIEKRRGPAPTFSPLNILTRSNNPPTRMKKQTSHLGNLGRKQPLTSKNFAPQIRKICIYFFSSPFLGKFTPISAILQIWRRKSPNFWCLTPFWVIIRLFCFSGMWKIQEEDRFLGIGNGDRNRISVQNNIHWNLKNFNLKILALWG